MTVYATPRTLLLTGPQVAAVAKAAGWKGDDLVTAVAIAYAETGGSLDAHAVGDVNLTGPGEQSTGLWQINYRPWRDKAETARQPTPNFDPATNARNAYGISGGGANFRPWSTFTGGQYKTYLDRARSAVAGATGAPILSSTTATGGSSVVAVPAPLPVAPVLSLYLRGLLIGGTVDLTTTKVSELSLDFADGVDLLNQGHFALGATFTHDGISWTVTSLRLAPYRGDISRLTVKASPSGIVRMRLTTPAAETGVSATDYMRRLAAASGLGFVGQESPVLPQVGPAQVPDLSPEAVVGAQKLETGYDIGVRLARDLAQTQPWVAFEAGGTYFFGVPQYLASHNRNVELSYGGASRHEPGRVSIPLGALPSCEASRTQTIGRSVIPRGVRINGVVDRTTGLSLRPGMRTSLAGVPVFDGDYLLSRVSWDVMPVPGQVTVEATDFPAIPGVGEISTLIPAPGPDVPQIIDPHPPTSGNYFQADRISYPTRTKTFGQPGDTVRYRTHLTPWGIQVRVHDLIYDQFVAACKKADQVSRWRPLRIDSYNNRNIANSSSKSLHSWALAWDFFDTANPTSIKGPTNGPDAAFRQAFKDLGFYAGAEFVHAESDYPHIEWASAPPTPDQRTTAKGV